MVLGERGAQITLIERDPDPRGDSAADAFDHWDRSGAPQVRHSHVFLGRLRVLLRQHYPFLLDALIDAGAREIRPLDRPPPALRDILPEPGDDDLIAIACRRTTFEWVMRRVVLDRYPVRLLSEARVTGLVATPGAPVTIAGVRYRVDGKDKVARGHLVIDASGRRSQAPGWLMAAGTREPYEKQESSGVAYYTRFYRMRPGVPEPPPSRHPPAADFTWIKYAIFPADDGVFSITLAIPLAMERLKVLAKAPAFDAMVRAIPGIRAWGDPSFAEPIGDPDHPVQAMGGLINRARRFVDEHGPLALRFFVLGDAAYCTNPLYGRGCSQGLLHAHFLGEALDEHLGEWRRISESLDARCRRELEPYYRASIVADRDAVRRAEGRVPRRLTERMQAKFLRDGVAVAMRTDPVVFRAFLRMINMFETPEEAFGRPEVVARTLWVMAQGEEFRREYGVGDPPDQEATIASCEAAIAA